MRLIFISEKVQRSRSARITPLHLILLVFTVLTVLVAAVMAGHHLASLRYEALPAEMLSDWRRELQSLRGESAILHERAGRDRQAYALRLATLQARLVRLDALGERLTGIAGLQDGEFDFSLEPAVGGPEGQEGLADAPLPELDALLDQLDQRLSHGEDQLRILEGLMANRRMHKETTVAGRPIRKGWMSSAFGRRTDPFHGGQAWHQGVDFAGREGADVISVAAGVVTNSGAHNGYGEMIEISHADGYVTRYAHNRDNLVSVGDVVNKGQVIARMGSSGRSTGPHVHFEVLRNGKAENPANYIYRASR